MLNRHAVGYPGKKEADVIENTSFLNTQRLPAWPPREEPASSTQVQPWACISPRKTARAAPTRREPASPHVRICPRGELASEWRQPQDAPPHGEGDPYSRR